MSIFDEKNVFKLICGAGNKNLNEIFNLASVYAVAGCDMIDVAADIAVVKTVKTALLEYNPKVQICVSVGVSDDIHLCKVGIDNSKCLLCGQCVKVCNRNAINVTDSVLNYDESNCIGCGKCINACPQSALSYKNANKPLDEILSPEILSSIDCIELHIGSENIEEINKYWNFINKNFNGLLSICTNRAHLGDKILIDLLKNMLAKRKSYSTVIQADGNPMSGGKDDFNSTLQAIAVAQLFINEKLPAYIIVSGGTNSKSAELARLCNVNINGVAIGSFARKIVKDEISAPDFAENNFLFESAVSKAKMLVQSVFV